MLWIFSLYDGNFVDFFSQNYTRHHQFTYVPDAFSMAKECLNRMTLYRQRFCQTHICMVLCETISTTFQLTHILWWRHLYHATHQIATIHNQSTLSLSFTIYNRQQQQLMKSNCNVIKINYCCNTRTNWKTNRIREQIDVFNQNKSHYCFCSNAKRYIFHLNHEHWTWLDKEKKNSFITSLEY